MASPSLHYPRLIPIRLIVLYKPISLIGIFLVGLPGTIAFVPGQMWDGPGHLWDGLGHSEWPRAFDLDQDKLLWPETNGHGLGQIIGVPVLDASFKGWEK